MLEAQVGFQEGQLVAVRFLRYVDDRIGEERAWNRWSVYYFPPPMSQLTSLVDFLSKGQRETQRRSKEFGLEISRVRNEGSHGYIRHDAVAELRSALLVDRLYADRFHIFWQEQQRCLDAFADILKSGRKPADADLEDQINLWRRARRSA